LRITISGLSGSGNTTACKNVAKALDLKILNYTFTHLAVDMGTTLEDIQAKALSDPYYDYLVDFKQLELSEKEDKFVIGSRLAGWLIENADLRVWLTASPEVRAGRIAKREGLDYSKTLAATEKRDAENAERYKQYYDIDVTDLGGFDLILNTELLSPEQVCSSIVESAKNAKRNKIHKPTKIAHHVREIVYAEMKKRGGAQSQQ